MYLFAIQAGESLADSWVDFLIHQAQAADAALPPSESDANQDVKG